VGQDVVLEQVHLVPRQGPEVGLQQPEERLHGPTRDGRFHGRPDEFHKRVVAEGVPVIEVQRAHDHGHVPPAVAFLPGQPDHLPGRGQHLGPARLGGYNGDAFTRVAAEGPRPETRVLPLQVGQRRLSPEELEGLRG